MRGSYTVRETDSFILCKDLTYSASLPIFSTQLHRMLHINFYPLEVKPRAMKSSIVCRNAPITVMSHPIKLVVVVGEGL